MKHAKSLIELMAAYPGRDWKMSELVRYVSDGKELDLRARRAVRKGVLRALDALAATGCVLVRPPSVKRGGFAVYRWK